MTISNETTNIRLQGEVHPAREHPKNNGATDSDLARRAAGGEIAAFEELYWKYHRRVYSICLRMCKNATESEDITQMVFLNLFRKIDSFRGDAAFSTWLHRMTVNQVLMYFRTIKTRKEQISADGELSDYDYAPRHIQPTRNHLIERWHLEKAIAQLPNGYRSVVILHDVEGFDHAEIAQILGCAIGTSKSQLHKARQKLRWLLAPDAETP